MEQGPIVGPCFPGSDCIALYILFYFIILYLTTFSADVLAPLVAYVNAVDGIHAFNIQFLYHRVRKFHGYINFVVLQFLTKPQNLCTRRVLPTHNYTHNNPVTWKSNSESIVCIVQFSPTWTFCQWQLPIYLYTLDIPSQKQVLQTRSNDLPLCMMPHPTLSILDL